jgi:capsular polysaccharide biosynthesis protein
MDVNEILHRIVRGHRLLLAVCLLVPLAAVAALQATTPTLWTAVARLQGGTVLPGSDTEADAILNVVKGIATSPALARRAADEAGVADRDPAATAAEIDVARLGSSAVFDLSVTDKDPQVAVAFATAAANDVVGLLNNAGDARTANLLSGLQARQKDLFTQRQSTAKALTLAKDPIASAAQLSGIDQQLTDLSSAISQLQVSGVSAAGTGSASVISPPTAAARAPRALASRIGLAIAVGLLLGLLLASLAEVLRPRVADAHTFARRLAVSVLGRVRAARGSGPGARDAVELHPGTAVTVRRAAGRVGVRRVLLVGPVPQERQRAVAAVLQWDGAGAGRVNGDAGVRPSPDHDGLGTVPAAPQRPTAVLERQIADPVAAVGATDWDVRPYADVDVLEDTAPTGLLALVPPLVRDAELYRVSELARATGLPVIGVLADVRCTHRRRIRVPRWTAPRWAASRRTS